MNDFTFSVPQNIMVGRGSLAKLPEAARQLGGSHAFIISGPHLTKMGLVDKVSDSLKAAGFAVDAFTETEGNPSTDTVEKAAAAYKASGADFIVAFGGGSPMDVAKAVGVVAKYGGRIEEYEGAHKVPGKIVPLIAIPTTAGTGSEVTAFSVITDHRRDYKLTVFSYELLPACAILDAELLTSAPASVAAACGIDAFIHAEEAYVSRAASPFSDAMAEKAMELEENQPFFVAQPMQRLRIPEPVDACVCALDSINYVTKPQDVQKAFRRVYESLRPGGLFVFDINTPYKLEGLDGQVFLDETEDSYCVWRTFFSEKTKICTYQVDLFRLQADGAWERDYEEHWERAWSAEELTAFLTDAGFEKIAITGDLTRRPPKDTEDRWIVRCRKSLKS